MTTKPTTAANPPARPVIVRSRDAGVIFGDYVREDGSTVTLTNARQMWRWRAAKGGTLIDCATHGVIDKDCRFSVATADVTIFNACAIISCTETAADRLRAVEGQPWK